MPETKKYSIWDRARQYGKKGSLSGQEGSKDYNKRNKIKEDRQKNLFRHTIEKGYHQSEKKQAEILSEADKKSKIKKSTVP